MKTRPLYIETKIDCEMDALWERPKTHQFINNGTYDLATYVICLKRLKQNLKNFFTLL